MARIRTIKPEFWVDDVVSDLTPWARLAYIALWNFVDDDGFIQFSPRRLKNMIFPSDEVDMVMIIAELVEHGRVIRLSSDQGPLLYARNLVRHQKIDRRTKTRFTGIVDEDGVAIMPIEAPDSTSARRVVDESPRSSPTEGNGMEGIVEGKGNPPGATHQPPPAGEATKSEPRPARGTKIARDFRPTDEDIAKLRGEYPNYDLRGMTAEFVDYWLGRGGVKGLKTDWDATWRNYIRAADRYKRVRLRGQQPVVPAKSSIERGQRFLERHGINTPTAGQLQ